MVLTNSGSHLALNLTGTFEQYKTLAMSKRLFENRKLDQVDDDKPPTKKDEESQLTQLHPKTKL